MHRGLINSGHDVRSSTTSVDMRIDSRNLQGDAIDARARRDIKRLVIGPSPGNIAHPLRYVECTEMLALRRKDPNPARARAIQIPSLVYLLAVGRAGPGIGCRIEKDFPSVSVPSALTV